MTELFRVGGDWRNLETIPATPYGCGFCGNQVAPGVGYKTSGSVAGTLPGTIHICPRCNKPTFFHGGTWYPRIAPGNPVRNAPDDLTALYEEARHSASSGAFTATVLVCRKMLMNIAVEEGAEEGLSFLKYVQYLSDNNYIPPKGRDWVDYIRKRGNEANHEIALMEKEDAIALITFVEMLLRFIYEFPKLVPGPNP